jgi:hypothetical protein
MAETDENELVALKSEVAPILRHILVVVVLISGAIGIGALIEIARQRMPMHAREFEWIELIDTWVILVLVSLFGAYMIALLAARLWKSVVRAWK